MNLKGKTGLITGSTDGVGRMVAERLGASGMRVLAHGRNLRRGAETVESIVSAGGDATFFEADLASLADTRKLATKVAEKAPRLDLLINNAGIGAGADFKLREESEDGHELRMAVNYLAPFLLTRLLLPNVKAAAPSRIVNVASIGQKDLDFEDMEFTKGYQGMDAYRRSKLALILFTFDLAQELEGTGVTVNTLHPATLMDTTMVREAGAPPMSTVEEGAEAIMKLAVGKELEGKTGLYFDGLKQAEARAQAYDEEARRRLREWSFEATGAPGT